MNQKNLSVRNKTHKRISGYLKDKKIFQIYKSFEKSINISEDFAVAVSGGPDSLSLAFLLIVLQWMNFFLVYDQLYNNELYMIF